MNTQSAEKKPTREELLMRCRNAQMRGKLGRMPKKQREEKLEKLKTSMEEQQQMLQQMSQMSPEQLRSMGVDEQTIGLLRAQAAAQNRQATQPVPVPEPETNTIPVNVSPLKDLSQPTVNATNPVFDVPMINIGRMKPVNSTTSTSI
jgi:hypothetical protein